MSFLKISLEQYFKHVEEIEWAIDVMKQCGVPIVAMMSIGPMGDHTDVPTGECFVRMAKAGTYPIYGYNYSSSVSA